MISRMLTNKCIIKGAPCSLSNILQFCDIFPKLMQQQLKNKNKFAEGQSTETAHLCVLARLNKYIKRNPWLLHFWNPQPTVRYIIPEKICESLLRAFWLILIGLTPTLPDAAVEKRCKQEDRLHHFWKRGLASSQVTPHLTSSGRKRETVQAVFRG